MKIVTVLFVFSSMIIISSLLDFSIGMIDEASSDWNFQVD
jgi:hypothetical protein